jgi:hypothetical protein
MRRTTIQVCVEHPWREENGLLKAPVVMMVEGVHHGSFGPIYWPAHVLQQSARKWNGVPVTIDHPKDFDGNPVPVQSDPTAIIGTVQRARFDSGRKAMKAEIQVPANHPRRSEIEQIREVSVGVFSDETYTPGSFNGEDYIACAIRQDPDHLALLPEVKGACSWEDGCGIRAYESNQRLAEAIHVLTGGNKMNETEKLDKLVEAFQTLASGEPTESEEALVPYATRQSDAEKRRAEAERARVPFHAPVNHSGEEEPPLVPFPVPRKKTTEEPAPEPRTRKENRNGEEEAALPVWGAPMKRRKKGGGK